MIDISAERKKQRGFWPLLISSPFIYGMFFPIVFIDISARIYQRVCFPIYGIKLVDRRKFVRLGGRGKGMVTLWDYMNCSYCGYANGVALFIREVLAQTERYWCPLRYTNLKNFVEPTHHAEFVDDNRPKELLKKIRQVEGRDG